MPGSTEHEVEVVLTGGPSDLPSAVRVRRVHHDERKIKIVHRGGYEHFERDAAAHPAGTAPIVYRWTTRTRIAE